MLLKIIKLHFLLLAALSCSVQASWLDWWQSKDQQGYKLLENKQYQEASEVFKEPNWKATAHYRAKNYKQAAKEFAQQKNYYNQGNALAQLGKIDEAISAYKQTLKNNPNHQDAKHNLSILEQMKQQGKQNQQNQQGEKQDGEQNQQQGEQQQGEQNGQQQSEQNQDGQKQDSSLDKDQSHLDSAKKEAQKEAGEQEQEEAQSAQQQAEQNEQQQSEQGEQADEEKDSKQTRTSRNARKISRQQHCPTNTKKRTHALKKSKN